MSEEKIKPIGIAELIARVRQDLIQSSQEVMPIFSIGQVEVEISFTVERKADGGINVQVVQLSGGGTLTNTHSVKVILNPLVSSDEILKDLSNDQKDVAKQILTRDDLLGK